MRDLWLQPTVGAAECHGCRRPAVPMSKFDVWLEALVDISRLRMRVGRRALGVLQRVSSALAASTPAPQAA